MNKAIATNLFVLFAGSAFWIAKFLFEDWSRLGLDWNLNWDFVSGRELLLVGSYSYFWALYCRTIYRKQRLLKEWKTVGITLLVFLLILALLLFFLALEVRDWANPAHYGISNK